MNMQTINSKILIEKGNFPKNAIFAAGRGDGKKI